jgi:DNA-binding response OmpR family regulator
MTDLICINSVDDEPDQLPEFVLTPNHAPSRETLLDLAYGYCSEPFDRSIDVRITRIRRKVERDPEKPQLIRTMRGAGYMFMPSIP